MPSKRQPLVRNLIREAAKGPSAPKIPGGITDLADHLDVAVDGALDIAGELVGRLTRRRRPRSPRHGAGRAGKPVLPAVARVQTEMVRELMEYADGKAPS